MDSDKEILKPLSERLDALDDNFELLSEDEKKLFYELFVLNLKYVFGKNRYHLFTDKFKVLISTISYFIKSAVSLTCFVYSFLYLKNNKKTKNHLLYLIPGLNLVSFFESMKIGYFLNIRTNIAYKGNLIPGQVTESKILSLIKNFVSGDKYFIPSGLKILNILFTFSYSDGRSLVNSFRYSPYQEIFPSHSYRMQFEYLLRDSILLYMISKKINSPLKNSNFLIINIISNFIINILVMIFSEGIDTTFMNFQILIFIIYLVVINLKAKLNIKRFVLNIFLLLYYSAACFFIILPITDMHFGTTFFDPNGGGDFTNIWLNNQLLNYFDIIIIIYSNLFLFKKKKIFSKPINNA